MAFKENCLISEEQVSSLVISVPSINAADFGEAAKEMFESRPELEGLVVMEHNSPVGLIMRNMFFQKMGSKYGYSLYMKRPVSILMDSDFLSVDADDSISKVGLLAAGRGIDRLHDYIVVYKNQVYLGVISIRDFFEELSKRNEAQISVLQEQQRNLIASHEQEQQLRKNLEYQSSAVRNLLDHAEQGFFWFTGDLIIKNEVSYKCFEIFGSSINGQNFIDIITPYFSKEKAQVFAAAFESYFKNNTPVTDTVYLMLLPGDCKIGEKYIHLQYKRIQHSQQKAVMVVMNDISDRIALEKAMAADRYRQRLLIKAFSAQPQIKRMIEEFRELFTSGYKSFFTDNMASKDKLDELFRSVHTYKGDFAQYGFEAASEKLHLLEDELSDMINNRSVADLDSLTELFSRIDADEILSGDLQIISEFLGNSYLEKSEVVSVPKSVLISLDDMLASGLKADINAVKEIIHSLLLRPVKDFLMQYEDYIEYLSGRVLKSTPIFLVEGDEVAVDGDKFDSLFKTLVHIFRNSIDHGIETDEDRVEAGKSERGCIHCVVTAVDGKRFSISISDDGNGIDLEKIKAKAVKLGICTQNESEHMDDKTACRLVFADRLSTKEAVSSLSGRGAGMSAVEAACTALNGSIAVETRQGEGTTFTLTLPY
jgi:two-component system chemotaxis sensor kinase CheA